MKYFVTIKDENGKTVELEVSAAVFGIFDDERRQKERQRNEQRRHYDKRKLEDCILTNACVQTVKSAEEVYMDREAIAEALAACTPTQRRRFCLNQIYGYSCTEIARLEGCHPSVVWRSVKAVMERLNQKK